ILFGLSLLPIAYGGGLRMRDPTENIAFERKELTAAQVQRLGQTHKETDPDAVPDGGSESSASTSDRISLDEDG
ncbi:hypothetical protein EXE48_18345, partial [Halorubrum sp. ASP1]